MKKRIAILTRDFIFACLISVSWWTAAQVIDTNYANWTCTPVDSRTVRVGWVTYQSCTPGCANPTGGSSKVLYGFNGDDNYMIVTPEQDTTAPGATTHSVTIGNLPPGSSILWLPLSHGFTGGVLDTNKEFTGITALNCATAPLPSGASDFQLEFKGPGTVVKGIPAYYGVAIDNFTSTPATKFVFTVSGAPACASTTWDLGTPWTKDLTGDSFFQYDGGTQTGRFRLDTAGCGSPPYDFTLQVSAHMDPSISPDPANWTAPPTHATPATINVHVQASAVPAQNPPGPGHPNWGTVNSTNRSNWENWAVQYLAATPPALGTCNECYTGASVGCTIDINGCMSQTSLGQMCLTNYGGSGTLLHQYDYDLVHNVSGNPSQFLACSNLYKANTKYWLGHAVDYIRSTAYGAWRIGDADAMANFALAINGDSPVVNSLYWAFNETAGGNTRPLALFIDYCHLGMKLGAGCDQATLDTALRLGFTHMGDLISGRDVGFQPFYYGLLMESMIRYWEDGHQDRDDVLEWVRLTFNYLWLNAWVADDPVSGKGWFLYNYAEYPTWSSVKTGAREVGMHGTSSFVYPAAAFLWSRFGDSVTVTARGETLNYRQIADRGFDSVISETAAGVNVKPAGDWIGYNGKNFNELYRWTYDYMRWRGVQIAPGQSGGGATRGVMLRTARFRAGGIR